VSQERFRDGASVGGSTRFHVLFGNAANGCVALTNQSTLASDPLYQYPALDDFRLQFSSPAKDSGANTGLDTNGPAPGAFFGAARDRGARETW
jgi:hypothetical protein